MDGVVFNTTDWALHPVGKQIEHLVHMFKPLFLALMATENTIQAVDSNHFVVTDYEQISSRQTNLDQLHG